MEIIYLHNMECFHLGHNVTFIYSRLLCHFEILSFCSYSCFFSIIFGILCVYLEQNLFTHFFTTSNWLWQEHKKVADHNIFILRLASFLTHFKWILTVSGYWVWKDLELTRLRKGGKGDSAYKRCKGPSDLQVLLGLWGSCAPTHPLDLPSHGLCLTRGPLETAIPGISPLGGVPPRLSDFPVLCDCGQVSPHWNRVARRTVAARPARVGGGKREDEGCQNEAPGQDQPLC